MNRFRMSLAAFVVSALFLSQSFAQNTVAASTTRLERQHGASRFVEDRLKQVEATILMALDTTWQGDQREALQTLRYLEQAFPKYPFAASVKPLERILKDQKADPVVRKLAALALDELHSEAADAAIKDVASSSDDKGLQSLCEALQVGSERWKGKK